MRKRTTWRKLVTLLGLLALGGCGAAPSEAYQPPAASGPLLVVTERVSLQGQTTPQVVAYQAGKQRWAVALSALGDALAAAEGVLYVGAGERVSALDAQTGKERWTASASPQVRSISVRGGQVYVDTGGGFAGAEHLLVFSLTGQPRWQYTPPAFQDIPAWLVDGGVFYTVVSGFPATLLALDAATGTPRWQAPLPIATPVRSLVPAGAAALLVVTQDRLVLAQRRDGREDWQRTQTLAVAPLVDAGVVYAFFVDQPTTPGGQPQPLLRALRVTDGSILWQQPLPASDAGFLAAQSILVAGGISPQAASLVDGADFTTVRVWNLADGSQRWTYHTSERIVALVADGQTLYLATAAQLVALRADTGQPRWQQPNPDSVTTLKKQAEVLLGENTLTRTLAGYDPASGRLLWRLHPEALDLALIV